jgi:long-chain acyl-CoA synthetase
VLTVGGDALAVDHIAELLRRRPGRELYLTYGLTQAGPRVSTLAAHAEPPERHGSVGLPLADTRVTLADLGDGSGRRQLLVSSDSVMRRRIGVIEGRPHDDWFAPVIDGGSPTAALGSAPAPPRVLATGDVFDDEDGYLYYRGRLSEYILREGEKICLAAVRRVATQLPDVVSARTTVTKHEGGEDFDLTLYTAEAREPKGPEVYRALLGRSLRRGELPRSIEVVPMHTVEPLRHK